MYIVGIMVVAYDLARQLEPNKAVIISESASTVSTRGFYEWPLPQKKTDFTKSLQVSSYDMNAPDWAEIPDDDFMWQQEENYVAGEFVWTGFDYLGEPTPYDNAAVKKSRDDRQRSCSEFLLSGSSIWSEFLRTGFTCTKVIGINQIPPFTSFHIGTGPAWKGRTSRSLFIPAEIAPNFF
jgi:hypothetical protein